MKKGYFILSLLLVMVFVLVNVGMAASKPMVIKYAHVSPADPWAQPSSACAAVFKNKLEELTQGRVKVEIFPSGQLGDHLPLLEQCLRGEIEIVDVSTGVMATALNYHKLGIFDIPYLFKSLEIAYELTDPDNPFTKSLMDDISKKTGIKPLIWAPMGFRHLTNNVRLVKGPEDMKGLKIRVMQVDAYRAMMTALGAQPVPIPFLELYTSLQTGVVDGQENPIMNIVAEKFYQVQKYLTLDGHVAFISNTITSQKWFNSLPPDIQSAVLEASKMARAATFGVALVYDAVGIDEIQKHGTQVYSPSPAELERFKNVAQPPVIELLKKQGVEETVFAELFSEIKKIEEKLGYDQR